MTVRFHPAARRELREGQLWYEERSPLSAAAFAQEVAAAVARFVEALVRDPPQGQLRMTNGCTVWYSCSG